MKRPLTRLCIVFIFAVIAFLALNVCYYRYCDKVSENALNEAIENHSEINEEEIMIEQFNEYSMQHMIKVQNESLN